MLLPLGSITSRSIQRPMLPLALFGSDSTVLGSTALVAAEPPKSERVPSLAVTSHQYVVGLLPWRTIFRNCPSTRCEKLFSAVRGTRGPRLATGASCAPLSMYVSV